MWRAFLLEFCKVDFLCYQGAPNWLGWVVLIGAALFVTAILGGFSR